MITHPYVYCAKKENIAIEMIYEKSENEYPKSQDKIGLYKQIKLIFHKDTLLITL